VIWSQRHPRVGCHSYPKTRVRCICQVVDLDPSSLTNVVEPDTLLGHAHILPPDLRHQGSAHLKFQGNIQPPKMRPQDVVPLLELRMCLPWMIPSLDVHLLSSTGLILGVTLPSSNCLDECPFHKERRWQSWLRICWKRGHSVFCKCTGKPHCVGPKLGW